MRKLALIVALSAAVVSTASLADNKINWNGGDGTQGLVFSVVKSDAELKEIGITRAEANRRNPAAEKQWRDAWAAKGTKADNETYRKIRQATTAPEK